MTRQSPVRGEKSLTYARPTYRPIHSRSFLLAPQAKLRVSSRALTWHLPGKCDPIEGFSHNQATVAAPPWNAGCPVRSLFCVHFNGLPQARGLTDSCVLVPPGPKRSIHWLKPRRAYRIRDRVKTRRPAQPDNVDPATRWHLDRLRRSVGHGTDIRRQNDRGGIERKEPPPLPDKRNRKDQLIELFQAVYQ